MPTLGQPRLWCRSAGQSSLIASFEHHASGPLAQRPYTTLKPRFVQAQVLNLLKDLQAQFGLTYVFVAHNLAVVAHISDRIGVMYLGKLVETGTTAEIYDNPKHPYTQALLSAIPIPTVGGKRRERVILQGDVPSPLNPPSGCPFHPRCPIANLPRCSTEVPVFEQKSPGHWVACHYAD